MADSHNSIVSYMKRLGRSISYSTLEVLKDQAPITTSFITTNKETVRETYKTIIDSKAMFKKASNLQDEYILKPVNTMMSNVKKDIKSGQFYHPEREEQSDIEMMKRLLGPEIAAMLEGDFTDEPIEGEEAVEPTYSPIRGIPTITKGDAVVASVFSNETRASTNCIAATIAETADIGVRTAKSIASMQFAQNERQSILLRHGFGTLSQGFNSLIEFNNKAMLVHIQNSQTFFEKMTDYTRENNAILKEIVEMQRQVYKNQTSKQEDEENKPVTSASLFENGLNLKEYFRLVKQNAENSPLGMVAMMVQMFPAMIQDVINNPMDFVTKQVMSTIMGPKLKTALGKFDETLSGFFQTGLAKLSRFGKDKNNKNSVEGIIARIFGFEEGRVSLKNIDTSKYNKGIMSWNGIAQKTLVEVLPGYLRRIEATLTGNGERVFDLQSGKWTNAKEVSNIERRIDRESMTTATKKLRGELIDMAEPYQFKNPQDKRRFRQAINKLAQGIYNTGFVDFDDIKINKENKYGDNQRLVALLSSMLENVDRSTIIGTTARINKAREAKASMARNIDYSSQGLINEYINRSTEGEIKAGRSTLNTASEISAPSSMMNLTLLKDSRGQTLYDYQLKIYKELYAIRNLTENGYGGGKRVPKSFISKLNPKDAINKLNPFSKDFDAYNGFDKTLGDKNVRVSDSSVSDKENTVTRTETVRKSDPNKDSRSDFDAKKVLDKVRARMEIIRKSNLEYYDIDEVEREFDIDRYISDKRYRKKMDKAMAKSMDQIRSSREKRQLESNDTMLGRAIRGLRGEDYDDLPEGIDPKAPILDQLLQANSIGEKFGVISRNINKLIESPTTILTSVITKADNVMYDFLFGKDTNDKDKDGKPVKGLFNKMVLEMQKTMDKLNIWMDEKLHKGLDLFKKFKDSSINYAKSFSKDVFGIDVDETIGKIKDKFKDVKTGVRETFSSASDTIKDAVKSTIADIGFKNVDGSKAPEQQSLFASGTKRVKRGGLAFISSGEAIIPADINPWNPDRDNVDRKAQSRQEQHMKNEFMSKLDGTVGKYIAGKIPTKASGTPNFTTDIGPKEIIALLSNFGISQNNIIDMIGKGVNKVAGKVDNPDAAMFVDYLIQKAVRTKAFRNSSDEAKANAERFLRASGYKEQLPSETLIRDEEYNKQTGPIVGVNQFSNIAFGTDIERAAKGTNDFLIKNLPEIAGGGALGGLLSLVFPLGGPLMGAVAGAAASVVSRSETAQKFLFGEEVVDDEGNKHRKGGIISEKAMQAIQKYMPDAKKYGITGSILGLVTPFGPLGGMMLGIGASIAKNNKTVNDFLFGDKGGLLNKDRKQAIRRAFPHMGAAMLGTFFFGPFGLLGNAALGAGMGLLSTTESFKRIMLGVPGKDGRRRGGLAGAIRRQITNPFKRTMKDMQDNLGKWFKNEIFGPIGRGLNPMGRLLAVGIKVGTDKLFNSLSNRIKGTIFEKIFDRTLGGVRKIGSLGKGLVKNVIGKPMSWIAKGVETMGEFAESSLIGSGRATNYDAATRLKRAEQLNMRDDILKADQVISGMNQDQLANLTGITAALRYRTGGDLERDLKRKRQESLDALYGDLDDIRTNNLSEDGGKQKIQTKLLEDIHKSLSNATNVSDVDDILNTINSEKFLDEKIKDRLRKTVRTYREELGSIDQLRERVNNNEVDDKHVKYTKDYFGYSDMSDDEFKKNVLPKLVRNLQAEEKHRKNALEEAQEESKSELKENQNILTEVQIDQLSIQKQMLNEIVLLNRFFSGEGYSSKASDVFKLTESNRETYRLRSDLYKGQRKLKEAEASHYGRIEDKYKEEVHDKLLRTRDYLGGENSNIKNLSDETLIKLTAKGDKESGKVLNLLHSIAANRNNHMGTIEDADQLADLGYEGVRRIATLTMYGYNIPANQYESIADLSKTAFTLVIQLAKLGSKFNNFDKFSKIEDDPEGEQTARFMLEFAKVKTENGDIKDLLTTSEMLDKLEDKNVQKLKLENNNNFQAGFNKEFSEGGKFFGQDEKFLKSKVKEENIVSQHRTMGDYDPEKLISRAEDEQNVQEIIDSAKGAITTLGDTAKSIINGVGRTAANTIDYIAPGPKIGASLRDTVGEAKAMAGDSEYAWERFKHEGENLEAKLLNGVIERGANAVKDSAFNTIMGSFDNIKLALIKLMGGDVQLPTNSIQEQQQEPEQQSLFDNDDVNEPNIGTHANGLVNAFIDKAAEKIEGKPNEPNNSLTQATPKADTESESFKDEDISSMGEVPGFKLNTGTTNAISESVNKSKDGITSIPTAEGDRVEYARSSADGQLMKLRNKNNMEVEKKQRAKQQQEEKQTSYLKTIADNTVLYAGKAGKAVAKMGEKATGSLFGAILEIPKMIMNIPRQMMNAIIPGSGDLVANGLSIGAGALGTWVGGKFLASKVGQKLKGPIEKLMGTKIGGAIGRRYGLDKWFPGGAKEVAEETAKETMEKAADKAESNNSKKTKKREKQLEKARKMSAKKGAPTTSTATNAIEEAAEAATKEATEEAAENAAKKTAETAGKKNIATRALGWLWNAAKHNKTKIGLLAALGTTMYGAHKASAYGQAGQDVTTTALDLVGVNTHPFDAKKYGINDISPEEQNWADAAIMHGSTPEEIIPNLLERRKTVGPEKDSPLVNNAKWAWNLAKDNWDSAAARFGINLAGYHALQNLGNSPLKSNIGAGAITAVGSALYNKYTKGEDISLWDIAKDTGLNSVSNVVLDAVAVNPLLRQGKRVLEAAKRSRFNERVAQETAERTGAAAATEATELAAKSPSLLKRAGKWLFKTKAGRMAALGGGILGYNLLDGGEAEAAVNPATVLNMENTISSKAAAKSVVKDNVYEEPPTGGGGILNTIGSIGGSLLGAKYGKKFGTIGTILGATAGGALGNSVTGGENTKDSLISDLVTNAGWTYGLKAVGAIKNKLFGNKKTVETVSDVAEDAISKPSLLDRSKNALTTMKEKGLSFVDKTKDTLKNVSRTPFDEQAKKLTSKAISSVNDVAGESSAQIQLLIGKLKSGLESVVSAVGKWIPGKGAKAAVENFTKIILDTVRKPQFIKKAMSKLARQTAALASGAATLGLGYLAITAVGAVSDFIHGYNAVETMLKIRPGTSTTGMRVVSGFVTAVCGAIPFLGIIIPEDKVLDLAIEYIGPAFGFGKRELDNLRKEGDKKVASDTEAIKQSSSIGDSWAEKLRDTTKGVVSSVIDSARSTASFITDKAKSLADAAGDAASKASNWVTDTAKSVGNWVYDKASKGIDWVADNASGAWDAIKDTSKKVYNKYFGTKESSTGKGKHQPMYGMGSDDNLPGLDINKIPEYNRINPNDSILVKRAKLKAQQKLLAEQKQSTGGFYSQLDPRFSMPFNASGDTVQQTMKDSGCGPVSAVNALSALGYNIDPRIAAKFALDKGYKEKDGGTKPQFFKDFMSKIGLGSNQLHNQNDIKNQLKYGNPVVLMGKDNRGETNKNPYAENPHYVTATGLDKNGNIIVQDPESYTPNKVYKASDVLSKSNIAISAEGNLAGLDINKIPEYNRINPNDSILVKRAKLKAQQKLSSFGKSAINYAKKYMNIPIRQHNSMYGRGTDMGAKIFTYLTKNIGLSNIVAAGIMGNMMAESSLNPRILQYAVNGSKESDNVIIDGENGYGLCQWTFITRQKALAEFAASKGKPSGDYQVQCDFMMKEIEERGGNLIARMDAEGSAGKAAILFHDEFEVSADSNEQKQRRANYAEQIFASEGKGLVNIGSYSSGSHSGATNANNKKSGLFAAIDSISGLLSSALNPFSNSTPDNSVGNQQQQSTVTNTPDNKDSKFTFEIPSLKMNDNGNTTVTVGKGKYGRGKYGRGLFDTATSMAQQMTGALSSSMSTLGSSLMSGTKKIFGDSISMIFGDNNPFADIFGLNTNKNDSPNSTPGSNSSYSGPNSMDIKVTDNPVDTILNNIPDTEITSGYGDELGRPTPGAHGGVDIANGREGDPIPSPIAGKVYDLGHGDGGGYGHYIQLQDSKGNYHMFGHCNSQNVSTGQQVKPGDILGTIGNTGGHSFGAHIHYQIDPPSNPGALKKGEHINPMTYSTTGLGKHGLSKNIFGKGINDIKDIPGLDNIPEYNRINVNDSILVKKAKYAAQNKLLSNYENIKPKIDKILESQNADINEHIKKRDISVEEEVNKQVANAPQPVTNNVDYTSKIDTLITKQEETNKLLSVIVELATKFISGKFEEKDLAVKNGTKPFTADTDVNVNTKEKNNSAITAIKAQLSQLGNGSKYGIGDKLMGRDSDGFTSIIKAMEAIASR